MQTLKTVIKSRLKRVRGRGYRMLHPNKEHFHCPICEYSGPFLDANDPTGLRKHAMCPNCSALERHRVLWLTIERLSQKNDFSRMSLLHFAPEPELEHLFRQRFGRYASADLNPRGVDHQVDLRKLPFPNASFDVVVASHVLEHIKEDVLALKNIQRILKPSGFAILQVPVIGATTVEYPAPNPQEWDHVRAPGEDYFDRYQSIFSRVEKYRSSEFEAKYQPFIYENRTRWPKAFPLRIPSKGSRHEDIVPVCYV